LATKTNPKDAIAGQRLANPAYHDYWGSGRPN
jgi:hypothetical protein